MADISTLPFLQHRLNILNFQYLKAEAGWDSDVKAEKP